MFPRISARAPIEILGLKRRRLKRFPFCKFILANSLKQKQQQHYPRRRTVNMEIEITASDSAVVEA